MKTAMQQHIEHLKIMQQMVIDKKADDYLTEAINTTLSGAIENAEHFLSIEKEQIIGSHLKGQWVKSPRADKDKSNNYYNETFN